MIDLTSFHGSQEFDAVGHIKFDEIEPIDVFASCQLLDGGDRKRGRAHDMLRRNVDAYRHNDRRWSLPLMIPAL